MSKYPRTYHLPFSPGSSNDDRIAKSVNSLLGVNIIISEKLDGENCGIERGGVYARSHALYTTSSWSKEVRQLHNILQHDLSHGVFLFGENIEGIHSIEYSNLTSYFYLFGVRDNMRWISWDEVEEYSYILNIPTVPVLFKGIINTQEDLKEIVEDLVSRPSKLGGECEGIVIRNALSFTNDNFSKNVMKWVRKNHITTDQHWSRNWKKSNIKR